MIQQNLYIFIRETEEWMKPSEDLFELIHSMSQAERKFFRQGTKRYAPDNPDKKYLLLYQAILGQTQYDELALKTSLQATISEGNFASWKRHLLEMVEHAIREYHAGKDQSERTHELIRESELLMRRGMWQRSRKKLDESKALAIKQEDFLSQIRINELERRLSIEFERKELTNTIQRLLKEWQRLEIQLQEEHAYVALFDQISTLMRSKFNPHDPSVAEQIQPYLAHPLLQPTAKPNTFRAQRMHHQARAFLFHLAKRNADEYAEYLVLLALWDSRPDFARSHPRLHKLALTNFLQSATKLDRLEEFPRILALMAAIPPENTNEAAEDFQTIELNHLLYHHNRYQLEEAIALFPRIEAGLKTYAVKINHARWLSFRMNMALIYFWAEKHADARRQIDLILDHPKSEHRLDVQALARLWEPILLFELLGADVAGDRLHALREWFRSKKMLLPFEKLVLSHFQALVNAKKAGLAATFQAFATALKTHRQTHGHANGIDEITVWAESRAQGIQMPVVLLRRKQSDDSASPT